jgi:hypothetical protein
MKVYAVRRAQGGCEPNCAQWIAAEGRIVRGSLAQFEMALGQNIKGDVPVLIYSSGGLAEEAMAIGRLIHSKGLDVGVARTIFTPCEPDDDACLKKAGKAPLRGLPDQGNAVCASACTLILAAGKRRFVRPPAFVGVHLPAHTDASDRLFDEFERYFVEMGIAKDIVPLMKATPNDSIHWMTRDELRSTRMATHRMSGDQLVRGSTLTDDGWLDPVIPPVAAFECELTGAGCTR